MKKATFLLSKDPSFESTGDLTMAKLLMDLARESFDVGAICLSGKPDSTADGYRRVRKSQASIPRLAVQSMRTGKSLVHTRFDIDGMVDAIEQTDTDVFVADHCYMAEPFYRAETSADLAVSTVVSETLVWKATRGLLGRLDSRRIIRDEVRVANSAYTVGTYDEEEAEFFRGRRVGRVHWLDLTLPPIEQLDIAQSPRRLVFFGDRKWAPNQEAFELLLQWWPDIARGIEGATLCILGSADPDAPVIPLPPGAEDLGFVDDLTEFLAGCRALVAPIRTGGGVRVKILDAASRGLPVVGTRDAVGSLGPLLGISALDDKDEFVDQCRRFLLDRGSAVAAGSALYVRNADRWRDGMPHATVNDWLRVRR